MSMAEQAARAREASFRLASVPGELKNQALEAIARRLEERTGEVLSENARDLEEARRAGLPQALQKRLALTEEKMGQMAASLREVVRLEDPVGRTLLARELDEGLVLTKVSVPIGVVGIIFEARPEALVQISSLCVKSGNAAILKGGSEAAGSNRILFELIRGSLEGTDKVFKDSLHLAETRADIAEMLKLEGLIDLVIPRGSSRLVKTILENTKIPVLGHAEGICALYVDREADIPMAVELAWDAKCQYPAVCNAIETLLVHREIAPAFLPRLRERLKEVELRGDEATRRIISAREATEADWGSEFGDLVLAVRVVEDLERAVEHINTHGSHHTDAIVTRSREAAERFMKGVDSASVMWNCSTRFADGFRYGFGAEVGIATGKIHARGPVGLEGLTSYKYRLAGRGQTVAEYAAGRRRFTHRNLA